MAHNPLVLTNGSCQAGGPEDPRVAMHRASDEPSTLGATTAVRRLVALFCCARSLGWMKQVGGKNLAVLEVKCATLSFS